MQEKLIELLIKCDETNCGIRSNEDMCPSSSISEIAEFIATYITS